MILQTKMTTPLDEIDISSDGAAQHFKQKYMFLWVTSLLECKGIHISWHFFPTAHGKGAVDGVGGTIKRSVFCCVKARSHHLTNALQYAECARQAVHNIIILYVENPLQLLPERSILTSCGPLWWV